MEELVAKNQVLTQQVEELREQFGSIWQQHLQMLQTQQLQQQQHPQPQPKLQLKLLKPTRPSTLKGTIKGSKVEDWLYQLRTYFDLVQVDDADTKIQFAASLLK
jgi:hypothetical protein